MTEICFQFDDLPYVVLKEIFENTDHKGNIELSLCNKKLYNTFLPLIWKNHEIIYPDDINRCVSQGFKKNGKYIKDLLILGDHEPSIIKEYFPNAINLRIKFNNYLKYQQQVSYLKLKGIFFDINGYESSLVSDFNTLKNIFKDLELVAGFVDEYLINNILSLLPTTIHRFIFHVYLGKFNLLKQVLDAHTNIKDLSITTQRFFGDFNFFNLCFPGLIQLELKYHIQMFNETIAINFEQFPKLKYLKLLYFKQVKFINNINLYSLHLEIDVLEENDLNTIQFPKLRILTFGSRFISIPSFLYLLSLPTITNLLLLFMSSDRLKFEILEPISNSSMITLELCNFKIGTRLINYLFNSCSLLSNLYFHGYDYRDHFTKAMLPKNNTFFTRQYDGSLIIKRENPI